MTTIVHEYSAKRVLRLTKGKTFVEKGGGKDGEYRYSKVELIRENEEEKSTPYISIKYGLKPTVVAAVNTIKAVLHKTCSKTVVVTLKNHVGWTKGMTRNYFITFKDDIDALSFVTEYNNIVEDIIAANKNAVVMTLEQQENISDEEDYDSDSGSSSSPSTTNKEESQNDMSNQQNDSRKDNEDCSFLDDSSTGTDETNSSHEDANENGDNDACSLGDECSDEDGANGENGIDFAASFDSLSDEPCTQDWPDEFKKLDF
jgi:hypothetical protein